MDKGKFITLEGGEGAGKSTQAQLLADGLVSAGLKAIFTREPGGAPGAEEIRSLLVDGPVTRWSGVSEALLHYAARREHLDVTVLPNLNQGVWVICDRFADSTMAYQGYGHGLGRDAVKKLHEVAVGDFQPDLTLILDLSVDEGLRRAIGRGGGGDRYEQMDKNFHQRIHDGFLEIANLEPGRCAVIDASGQIDDVQAEIRKAVSDRLKVEFS